MELSSAKEKYMASSTTSCETIWICRLLAGLFDQKLDPTIICCDNQSCIKLSKNMLFHDKSKDIEIKYPFIQDMIQKGEVKLQYIPTDQQIDSILSKSLTKGKFEEFRDKLGLVQNSFLTKREC
jgi:hypothetical protein